MALRGVPRQPSEPPSAAAIAAAADTHEEVELEPKGITIVSFGATVQSGKMFLEEAREQFHLIDAREYLPKDPASVVSHEQNGTFTTTQNTIFGQNGVVDLLQQLVEAASDEEKLGIGCRQGMHRSDTIARALEDALNMVIDNDGNRVYNAKHFPLSSALGKKGYTQMLAEAKKWSRKPWVVMEGGPMPHKQRYGYEACTMSEAASRNWLAFHSWLDEQYGTMPKPLLPPPPPPPVPIVIKDEEAKEEQHEDRQAADLLDVGFGVHGVQHAPEPTLPSGSKRPFREPEPWETFNRDPSVWVEVLATAGVDTVARQELFLLAQHSDAGFTEANSIIGKLLKKQADREECRNVSAFVHTCVCKARGNIGSWNYRPGQGGSSSSARGGKQGKKGSGKGGKW